MLVTPKRLRDLGGDVDVETPASVPASAGPSAAVDSNGGKSVAVQVASVPAALTWSGTETTDGDAPAPQAPTVRRRRPHQDHARPHRLSSHRTAHPLSGRPRGSVSPVARRGPGGQGLGRASEPPAGRHPSRLSRLRRESNGPQQVSRPCAARGPKAEPADPVAGAAPNRVRRSSLLARAAPPGQTPSAGVAARRPGEQA